jgi:hypothetical protein
MTLFLLSFCSFGERLSLAESWVQKTPREGGGHLARRRPLGARRA